MREISKQSEMHQYIYAQLMLELERRKVAYGEKYFTMIKNNHMQNMLLYVLLNNDKLSELFRKIKESRADNATNAESWFPSLSGIFRQRAITGEIGERTRFHERIREQTLRVCETNIACAKAAAHYVFFQECMNEIGLLLHDKRIIQYQSKKPIGYIERREPTDPTKIVLYRCDILEHDRIVPAIIAAERAERKAMKRLHNLSSPNDSGIEMIEIVQAVNKAVKEVNKAEVEVKAEIAAIAVEAAKDDSLFVAVAVAAYDDEKYEDEDEEEDDEKETVEVVEAKDNDLFVAVAVAAYKEEDEKTLQQNVAFYERAPPKINSSTINPESRDGVLSFFTKTTPDDSLHTQLITKDTHHMLDFFRSFIHKIDFGTHILEQTRHNGKFTKDNRLLRDFKKDLLRFNNFTFVGTDIPLQFRGKEYMSETQIKNEIIPIIEDLPPYLAEIVCNFHQGLYGPMFTNFIHDNIEANFDKPLEFYTLITILPDRILYHSAIYCEQIAIEEDLTFIGVVTVEIDPRTLDGFIQFDKYDITLFTTSFVSFLVDQFENMHAKNFKIASRNAQISVLDAMLQRMVKRMQNRLVVIDKTENTFSEPLLLDLQSAIKDYGGTLHDIISMLEPDDDIKIQKIGEIQTILQTDKNGTVEQLNKLIEFAERYFINGEINMRTNKQYHIPYDFALNNAWYDQSKTIPPNILELFVVPDMPETILQLKNDPAFHNVFYRTFMKKIEKKKYFYEDDFFDKKRANEQQNKAFSAFLNDNKLHELLDQIKQSRDANAESLLSFISGWSRRSNIKKKIEKRSEFNKQLRDQTRLVCKANFECMKAAANYMLFQTLINKIGLYLLENNSILTYNEKKIFPGTCDIQNEDPILPAVKEAVKGVEEAIRNPSQSNSAEVKDEFKAAVAAPVAAPVPLSIKNYNATSKRIQSEYMVKKTELEALKRELQVKEKYIARLITNAKSYTSTNNVNARRSNAEKTLEKTQNEISNIETELNKRFRNYERARIKLQSQSPVPLPSLPSFPAPASSLSPPPILPSSPAPAASLKSAKPDIDEDLLTAIAVGTTIVNGENALAPVPVSRRSSPPPLIAPPPPPPSLAKNNANRVRLTAINKARQIKNKNERNRTLKNVKMKEEAEKQERVSENPATYNANRMGQQERRKAAAAMEEAERASRLKVIQNATNKNQQEREVSQRDAKAAINAEQRGRVANAELKRIANEQERIRIANAEFKRLANEEERKRLANEEERKRLAKEKKPLTKEQLAILNRERLQGLAHRRKINEEAAISTAIARAKRKGINIPPPNSARLGGSLTKKRKQSKQNQRNQTRR